ncbi:MAG: hypothetical protein OER97_07345 [Gammaproteobacteria bacterium]|nr:hypothetical protein [Gammaproteobacteria bacterium]
MKKVSVLGFLKAVRRRLWFENLLSRMRVAVWVGSGVLLALAVINALLTSIPFVWVVGAAVLAAALVALPEMLRRPTLVECAVRADHQFGGHSVLTTALDTLRGSISRTRSCAVVISQSEAAVAAWWPRVNSIWAAPSPTAFVLAAVPTFVALLLLVVSSPQLRTESAAQSQTSSGAETVDDADDSVVALRDSIRRDLSVGQTERTTLDGDRHQSTDMAPSAGADTELVENPAGAPPESAVATPGAGTEAGDARRTSASPATQAAFEQPSFAGRTEQQIQRRGETTASLQAGDTDFRESLVARRIPRGQLRPAAAPPTASPWTAMTAAEVAYARVYLDERNLNEEVSLRD